MSHREAEEIAAEIAWMQDDPSFRPKKDPLKQKPVKGSGWMEYSNYARHYINDTPTGHEIILVSEDGSTLKINCKWPKRRRTKDGRVIDNG
jgi:hypothetical protein